MIIENIRGWIDLPEEARQARLDAAAGDFPASTYTPRRGPAMSDPTPTPDRVTPAMKAEIRERLGRGGNGMTDGRLARRGVDTANPDNPGRFDDGEPMRPKQEGLVYVLLEKELRPLNPAAADAGKKWFEAEKAKLTKVQCSNWIDRIRKMIAAGPAADVHTNPGPVADRPRARAWERWRELAAELVEFGGSTGARFAIPTGEGAVNELAFWWIVPGKSHHKGKFFLRQVIGGQGAVRVQMSVEAMISVAEKIIRTGPKDALLRFGQELGHCGHCGRELTNDESRAFGIGPTCRSHKGW